MTKLITPSMDRIVRYAKVMASRSATDYFAADPDRTYFEGCKHVHLPTGTFLIYTRDFGHHSSGWIKNPDYERCLHLSLSFYDVDALREDLQVSRPHDRSLAGLWCQAFFRDKKRWLWAESPKTAEGRTRDVWHYRLFCDEHWQPILPRGEVYGTDLTEVGWKSWSEVQADRPAPVVPTSMLPDGSDV